ncbi:MAG: hypothetical protein F6K41_30185 [Symploca sp. SIO3E6]|nr:hypothetical protein [Caldora sp. SIO3E6]
MLKKLAIILISSSLALLTSEALLRTPAFTQSAQQNANTDSTVDGDFNNVIQVPNQNNAQNSNINEFNFPNIYPLDNPIHTPVNTENDFGFNLSLGMNTLDASNVTLYLGIIYQPGRTRSHQTRMNRLSKETELLEAQRQIAEAQLQLLQQQITEAEIRLQF